MAKQHRLHLLLGLILLSSCIQEKTLPKGDPTLSGRVVPTIGDGDQQGSGSGSALEEALEGFRPGGKEEGKKALLGDPGVVAQPPRPKPPSPPHPESEFVEGQVIALLGPGALDAIPTLHEREGLEGFRFELGPWASPKRAVIVIRPDDDPEGRASAEATRALVPTLSAQPEFGSVELNFIRRAHATVNDPLYGHMWHFRQLGMEQAWDITTGSEDIVVAVLDSGFGSHPDLDPRMLPGYDMVSALDSALDGDGRDPDPSPAPGDEHGLIVAGTIGAVANNGIGIAGVDWNAKILPVRVLGAKGGASADVMAGIYWAIGEEVPGLPVNPNPAKVLNLSFGGGSLVEAEQEAVSDAIAAGAIVIVTAGNDNEDASLTSYSGYEGVIVVGGTDYLGHRAPYSSWGRAVHVMAPGGHVEVDRNGDGYLDGVIGLSYDGPNQGVFVQGTSIAAPQVSGLVSLMLSLRPSLTREEVLSILMETADPGSQCSQGCGAGLIDPVRALQAVARLSLDNPPELHVFTDRIDLGTEERASLTIGNKGGHTLKWRARVVGPAAASVELGAEAGELLERETEAIDISIDRNGLERGVYQAEIEVTGWGDVERVPLLFRVGDVDALDVGEVSVFTVRFDPQGKLVVGARHRTRYEDDYRFSLTPPPGEWFLVAWADQNRDGAIDEGDQLAVFSDSEGPALLELEKGQDRSGLELALTLPPEETDGEAPCANLRRCWEQCGDDAACAEACAIEGECLGCYQETIRPCQRAAECDLPGRGCCGVCEEEFSACFGQEGCLLEPPWFVSGGVGSPCSASRDCDEPYDCDTSVPGGMCTMPCSRHRQCPGGLCVRLRDDAAFCLASCTGGGCPRPQDECSLLTSGASACFP